MADRNRFFRMVFLFFLFVFATGATWADTMAGITSPGSLAANDSVSWSQLGANGTLLGASFNATSGKALAVSGSFAGPNSVTARVCASTPCSWRGAGFTAGDTLIWSSDAANAGNGPLTLSFAKKISGAGAFIQADGPGAFTAQIQAFNGGTSLGTFSVTSTNGNAAFIGILDQTAANISSVVFSLSSCVGTCTDFAIDTVSLNTGGSTTFPLTVSLAGTGSGTVTSNPAGISCPGTCSANFNSGTTVTLTAAAGVGSTFAGWSGACSGTGTCTVAMTAAQSVTATFNASQTFPLTVSLAGNGSGTVASNPAGISCPGTCTTNFASGTSVTLTAAASSGSTFAGWSGACSGTGTCTVSMTAAKSVIATFNASQFVLSVSTAGTGSGTVTSTPTGISCPGTCTANFNAGTTVTLTAAAASGSTFAGWSGACTGTGTCTIAMTATQSVTATFNASQLFPLTVTLAGTGSGSVTSNPAGINCPGVCSSNYSGGTVVTLIATASAGSTFAGWTGACIGKGSCTVTMNGATLVKAKFTIGTFPLTVTKSGSGTGSVKSTPSGINCGTKCSHNYKAGTLVTLSETPSPGHTFGGWSGACSGTGSCKVTMSAAETVGAKFN